MMLFVLKRMGEMPAQMAIKAGKYENNYKPLNSVKSKILSVHSSINLEKIVMGPFVYTPYTCFVP